MNRSASEIARANGVAVATVRKRGALLGGHKLFGRWRFPEAAGDGAHGVTRPTKALRELSEEVSGLATIGRHRDNRLNARLEAIERRLAALERQESPTSRAGGPERIGTSREGIAHPARHFSTADERSPAA